MPEFIPHPSPNWNERPEGTSVDTVIIHYTGMETGVAALTRLCDPAAEVSAHYLIEEDGRIFALVDEGKRAWHAGVSFWRGRENLNHNSIGIELVNPGHDFGYRAFPEVQITSLLAHLEGIAARHDIKRDAYIGHSDIAPDRKTDPGELFPWERLATQGFGLWPTVAGYDKTVIAERGQKNANVMKFNKQLGIVGYHTGDTQSFDATTEFAVRAFQAHWRPEAVTGQIDIGTAAVLEDIAGQSGQ